MKYKKEWLKGENHETASLIDNFLIANGMGRTANVNTWVTHSCPTLGQPRTTKNVLNFVGGQRVETTLQDIDSGIFSLPTGHPMIEHVATIRCQMERILARTVFPDGAFSDENEVIQTTNKLDIYN